MLLGNVERQFYSLMEVQYLSRRSLYFCWLSLKVEVSAPVYQLNKFSVQCVSAFGKLCFSKALKHIASPLSRTHFSECLFKVCQHEVGVTVIGRATQCRGIKAGRANYHDSQNVSLLSITQMYLYHS